MQNIDPKTLAPIKAQATKAAKYAGGLVIKTPADEKAAIEELSAINKIGDEVKERKDKILRPLLDATKATRELFKPIEESVENAVAIIKKKLITYRTEAEKKQEEEKAKLGDRVEKGTLKPETAVRKLNEMQTLEKSVGTNDSSVQYKTVKKVRIVNEQLIPREYLLVNEPAVRKAALAGTAIPGVEVYEEKEIANKR